MTRCFTDGQIIVIDEEQCHDVRQIKLKLISSAVSYQPNRQPRKNCLNKSPFLLRFEA